MSLRAYIFLMILATLACALALLAVIYFFDPFAGGLRALIIFYISLFLTLIGAFSLLGLIARLIFTRDKLIFKIVIISFRQGVWFSILIIASLVLKSLNLLAWSNFLLLITALAILELFFMSYKSKPSLKI